MYFNSPSSARSFKDSAFLFTCCKSPDGYHIIRKFILLLFCFCKIHVKPFLFFLQNFSSIDRQFKRSSQYFCRFSAQHHSSEKDLKIVIHRTDFFINLEIQCDLLFFLIHFQLGICNRIIYSVMNIESRLFLLSYTASSDICFICDDQGG